MEELIIDSNAVCHRARHAMKGTGLSHNEMKTEVIFSFMNQIYSLAQYFNTNKFVFVWDSRESKRRKMYPDYKKRKQEKTPEEIEFDNLTLPQFDKIRCEVLPALGFNNIFMQNGYEADDIIATIVMQHKDRFTIISRDNDLYQLLFYAKMYDPQSKKMLDKKSFYKIYGIVPSKWAWVKATAGCTSDNVKGIYRIGESTALKYLRGELKDTAKTKAAIEESGDLIRKNMKLVKLPLEGTNSNIVLSKDILTARRFIETFTKLGFRTFLTDREFKEWEKIFRLK